ncbi:MAG: diguanylate cyclase domain-containing protein [Desulfonatronovibrio sp.]
MDEKILDALFEPACILDRDLSVKFINTAWLQFVSKSIHSLDNEIRQINKASFEENFYILKQGIRPYVEDEAFFSSMDKRISYRICSYGTDFLMILKLPFSESSEMLYDTLTGLPTRAILNDRISNAIADCNRNSTKLLVFFIDLDDFKPVNDQYGHEAGDAVLIEVVRRIQEVIRDADTLARYGGDEFAIVCPSFKEPIHGALTAKRILRSLARKITYKKINLQIGASIGIGIYPDNAADSAGLLKVADKAMYMAKENGKNVYSFFSKEYRY